MTDTDKESPNFKYSSIFTPTLAILGDHFWWGRIFPFSGGNYHHKVAISTYTWNLFVAVAPLRFKRFKAGPVLLQQKPCSRRKQHYNILQSFLLPSEQHAMLSSFQQKTYSVEGFFKKKYATVSSTFWTTVLKWDPHLGVTTHRLMTEGYKHWVCAPWACP